MQGPNLVLALRAGVPASAQVSLADRTVKLANCKDEVEGSREGGGKRTKHTARHMKDCLAFLLLWHLEKGFLSAFVYSHTYFFVAFDNDFISI